MRKIFIAIAASLLVAVGSASILKQVHSKSLQTAQAQQAEEIEDFVSLPDEDEVPAEEDWDEEGDESEGEDDDQEEGDEEPVEDEEDGLELAQAKIPTGYKANKAAQ